MKDEYYRSLCLFKANYDKVFDWIVVNNPSGAEWWRISREEFAAKVIHNCIRAVLFGEEKPMFVYTGMCIAVRANSNPNSPNYQKVILAINL